jgi:tRNA-splicing ligase RtcB
MVRTSQSCLRERFINFEDKDLAYFVQGTSQFDDYIADMLWVWLTRKGAIKANMGDRGVIPGSMGTRSYLVSGPGNPASYHSCSHGAGRRLGRKQAERELTYESLVEAMQGKTWNQDKALVDEHPLAYKDIDEMMAAQADSVEIEHTLHQVLNYKGT